MGDTFVLRLEGSDVFYKNTDLNDSFILTPFPSRAGQWQFEQAAYQAARIYSKQWGLTFVAEVYQPFV